MNETASPAPDHQLHKTLRWYHGFMLALPIASGLFVSVGYVIGSIGAIPAAVICVVLSVVALLQNTLFSEMAAMFPDKAGGVATFATEAWKRYFAPLGPLAAFGYWCGWSLVLSLVGLTIGSLVQAQWFPDATWTLFSLAGVDFGLPHVISAITIVLCTALNVAGITVAVKFNQVIGAAFIVVLAALAVGPFVSGEWHSVNLTSHVDGGWKTFVVWLYVSAWAIYGSELCAVFAPEYKDTSRDTSRALTSIALFMVGVYTVVPIATTGQLGEGVIAENPITYGVASIGQISGGLSGIITAVLCGALFLSMISSSADAGRALFGIAAEGMSVTQLDQLNRNGVPSRALWITMTVNLLILVFIGNPVAILIASNLGYILAITLAVIGFLLLRKDRPHWPRPIRLSKGWIPVAAVVAVLNTFMLVVGVLNPGLSHAGGPKEVLLGIALLLVGVALFLYRRKIQDRAPLTWRDTSGNETSARRCEELPQFRE
ncbi:MULTISPECIES: APC family permease [unclassified Rhodococcus (in: high G+C Gram-positive bacteria)]|uniref:APC family permease n=1 Tax=unclassified Rhodococcus (in: high G+C Gram-positive bacteria) TaxID=192944 RepID=UPI001639DC8B|nr:MULTISPECIES: APC family permease [unclassified Rhodococcus (in: high G+C Gram-positive bacteria)]MBC2640311.1 APC family permease [Rhodococcus sp. 3A]MBC2894943.1 APC family permease [Rhodococcus sp. 4CII]